MNQLIVSLIFIFSVFFHHAISAAEMEREFGLDGVFTAKVEAINAGNGNILVRYDGLFVGRSVTTDKFGDDASFHCLGQYLTEAGKFDNDTALCKILFSDGDTAFLSFKSAGVPGGGAKGAFKFVGGTGRYEGIAGKGTIERYGIKSAVEGMSHARNKLRGTYKLAAQ